MHTVSRRFCALVIAVFICLPVLAYTAEKPVAWLALRSYQRLEQRLRDFSTMAKTPGLADVLLGMVQLQLAGLGGLDRQRPLGLMVPTMNVSETPPVAVLLPYTDTEAIIQTLRGFFPQTMVEEGGRLSLQGGPMPAFGHLDTATKTLVVANTPEVTKGFDVGFPSDLFGPQDGGPDLVLRVDIESVKQRLDTAWQSMLTGLERVWQDAAQQAAQAPGATAADQEALNAYMQLMYKTVRQGLDDLWRSELRLTLAPTGWVVDLEARMRPGSSSATLLNQQAGHVSRASHLFTPEAALRLIYSARMTDTLRQELTSLMPALRQMLDTRLAAMAALTPEQREAGSKAITTYFHSLEQWWSQKDLESMAEMRLAEATGVQLTSWGSLPGGANMLGALLDVIEKIPLFNGNAPAKVSRNIAQHRGTAIHRVELPQTGTPDVPSQVFLAAPDHHFTFHLGASPEPLNGLLDRLPTLASQPPVQTDAMFRMELFLAPFLKLAASKGQLRDPLGKALVERLQQGPNEPILAEVLTRQDSATLRYTTPGPMVQGVAEVAGQHMMQQLRGGSSSGGSGSGGSSGNTGGKGGGKAKK